MSKTTHWCPPLSSRRVMLAPIRPRPITPSCMISSFRDCVWPVLDTASPGFLECAIAPDQRIGRAVVVEGGFRRALELRDDPLGQHLAQFDAPLIEGVDLPD